MTTLSEDKIAAAAVRLTKSRDEAQSLAYASGKECGRRWACEDAEWSYLSSIEEVTEESDEIDFDTLAEALDGDTESGRTTLLDYLGDDATDADASPDWLKGFVDGAVEAWGLIEKRM